MANTFKVKTKLNVGISSGISTIYTVPSSTTAVLVGLTLANTSSNSITATVTLTNNDGDNVTLKAAGTTALDFVLNGSTDVTLDAPGDIKLDAAGADIKLLDDTYKSFIRNGSLLP